MFKDVDPRQPGSMLAQAPRENPPVEYKCWRAQDGFSPGPGWEFVGGREEQGNVSYYKDTNTYDRNGQCIPLVVPMWNPGAQWLIFRRRRDTIIEELQAKVDEWEAKERTARQELFDMGKQAKELAVRLAEAETTVTNRNGQLSQKQIEIQAERDRCKKMEVDIQKLRTALGELRMQEILG